jgi:hypothetical protein
MIHEMSVSQKCDTVDLVQVIQGGLPDNQGTWIQEDLALVFAQWLSPAFYIWCNKRIKELLQKGYTKLDSISRKDLAKMLFESEEAKEKLEAENHNTTLALKEAAPKVLFADAVATSSSSILIGELAKILKQNGIETGQGIGLEQILHNGLFKLFPLLRNAKRLILYEL